MGEGGSDRCERESVCDGEGRGDEQRAIGFVSLNVERRICVDDLGDIVYCPGIIKGIGRHQRKVGAVPDVCVLRRDGEKAKMEVKYGRLT